MEIARDIFVYPEMFTKKECQEFIFWGEGIGFTPATISYFSGAVMRPDIRNNDRVILDDPSLAARLWERVGPSLPSEFEGHTAIGLNERFRFYRYEVGQKFTMHRDGSYVAPTGARSLLTFMIYLNDECTGGETWFESVTIPPETGKVLVFRHRLLHEGKEVTSGRKYVLRSDIMFL